MNEFVKFDECNVVNDRLIVTTANSQDWYGHFFMKPPARIYIGGQKVQFDYFGWDGECWIYFCKEQPSVSLEIMNDLQEWRTSQSDWAPVDIDESGCRVERL